MNEGNAGGCQSHEPGSVERADCEPVDVRLSELPKIN
jgi:hypothetical protein